MRCTLEVTKQDQIELEALEASIEKRSVGELPYDVQADIYDTMETGSPFDPDPRDPEFLGLSVSWVRLSSSNFQFTVNKH